MNLVSRIKFLANLGATLAMIVVILAMALRTGGESMKMLTIGLWAVLIIGILAMLLAIVLRPKDARAASDEMNTAADRLAYVWGYWGVMIVFLGLFAMVWRGAVSAETAFFLLAIPLGLVPSVYQIWAVVTGRAG